jgi:hypothetical protein
MRWVDRLIMAGAGGWLRAILSHSARRLAATRRSPDRSKAIGPPLRAPSPKPQTAIRPFPNTTSRATWDSGISHRRSAKTKSLDSVEPQSPIIKRRVTSVFVDAFPMMVSGKAQKYLMRRAMTEELALVEEKTA